MSAVLIDAIKFADARHSTVQWAESVAHAAVAAVSSGQYAVISFVGVRGVSSSFFNVILLALRDRCGLERSRSLVRFDTDTTALKSILDRSLKAVWGNGSHGSTVTT